MHFDIYLDDHIGIRLNKMAKTLGKPSNVLIRDIIVNRMNGQEDVHWPEEVMTFDGVSDFPPFESYRVELSKTKDDPLA